MGGGASWVVAQGCVPGPRALPSAREMTHDTAPSSAQASGAKGVGSGLLWQSSPPTGAPAQLRPRAGCLLPPRRSQPAALGIRKAVAWDFRILKRSHSDCLLREEDAQRVTEPSREGPRSAAGLGGAERHSRALTHSCPPAARWRSEGLMSPLSQLQLRPTRGPSSRRRGPTPPTTALSLTRETRP
ncbi:unnamed protein product, partial [Gulo gulo]